MFEGIEKPEFSLNDVLKEVKKDYSLTENDIDKKNYKSIIGFYSELDLEDIEKTYYDSFNYRNQSVLEENCTLKIDSNFKMRNFWKTAKKNKIIKDIKNTTVDTCPCCEIEMADIEKSIDHVLPKSNFNQYIIMPNNLVPICKYCNQNKGDDTDFDENLFFHPYFSSIEYSIKNIDIKFLIKNSQQFQFSFFLIGDINEKVKYNFSEVYKISSSYRARIKETEKEIVTNIMLLRKTFKNMEEAKNYSKNILRKKVIISGQTDRKNLKYIENLAFSLYLDNFEVFFDRIVKTKLVNLED